jgi:putative toxin-antitoxin system antitoxin component (TIGR02293 family)
VRQAKTKQKSSKAQTLKPSILASGSGGPRSGISVKVHAIEHLAEAVFGDKEVATSWLREPNLATDNKPPVDLLGATEGYERVINLLLRIEYGILA